MPQNTNYEDNIPDVSKLYTRINEAKIKGNIREILKCISAGIKLGHYDVIEHGYQSLEIARIIKNGEIDPKDRSTVWRLEKEIRPKIPRDVLIKAFLNAYSRRGCDLHVPYTSISKIYCTLFGRDFMESIVNGISYHALPENQKSIFNEILIRQKLISLGYQQSQ
ncbi:MAG: hypothetical protein QXF88_00100 [Candidatus Aenigmatarchaeota archaeon]